MADGAGQVGDALALQFGDGLDGAVQRHDELVEFAIDGAVAQVERAHEIAGGNGAININVLWEMGGAQRVLEGVPGITFVTGQQAALEGADALLIETCQDLLQVKAAVMNTATNDLFTDEGRTGAKYGPARVGAGRIRQLDEIDEALEAQ